jgi:hypothetical protein
MCLPRNRRPALSTALIFGKNFDLHVCCSSLFRFEVAFDESLRCRDTDGIAVQTKSSNTGGGSCGERKLDSSSEATRFKIHPEAVLNFFSKGSP